MNQPQTLFVSPVNLDRLLPPSIDRSLPGDRIANLHAVASQRSARCDEARAALKNPLTPKSWRPYAERWLASCESTRVADLQRVKDFESERPKVERAVAEEMRARGDLQRALAEHFQGSLDRKHAIDLRNEVEWRDQVLAIRNRETEVAAGKACALLPMNQALAPIPGREIADGLATSVLRRKFPTRANDGTIDPATKKGWYEMTDDDLAGVWVWAVLNIERAQKERQEARNLLPGGVWAETDSSAILDVKDYVAALEGFLNERAAHLRNKAHEAQRALEAAKAQIAALAV